MIFEAINTWRKSESGSKNYWRIAKEHGSDEALVDEIFREIRTRRLRFRPIRYETRTTPPSCKPREIGQESVKQQIVDYVTILAMEDFLNAKIGFYQVASIKDKGPFFSARTVKKWIWTGLGYWSHLDAKKCYQSIKADVVMRVLEKYIRSDDILYMASVLLSTYRDGLSIGSFFSLKMAQLILSFGYHFLEQPVVRRRGKNHTLVDHQLWYADDVYLFSRSKKRLSLAIIRLQIYMSENFGVYIRSGKIRQINTDEPVKITMFMCDPNKTTIKSDLFLRIRRAYENFKSNPNIHNARKVCSYWGYLKKTNTFEFVIGNGYDKVFRQAKQYVSTYDRRRKHGSGKPRSG